MNPVDFICLHAPKDPALRESYIRQLEQEHMTLGELLYLLKGDEPPIKANIVRNPVGTGRVSAAAPQELPDTRRRKSRRVSEEESKRPFAGLTRLMRPVIKEFGQPMTKEQVAKAICRNFGITSESHMDWKRLLGAVRSQLNNQSRPDRAEQSLFQYFVEHVDERGNRTYTYFERDDNR